MNTNSETILEKDMIFEESNIKTSVNDFPKPLLNIVPKNFHLYTYSKKEHLTNFHDFGYDYNLLKKNIDFDAYDIFEYQSLLTYSFILKNVRKGAQILAIGSWNSGMIEIMKYEYEIFLLEDANDLLEDFKSTKKDIIVRSSSGNEIKLNESLNFFDFVYSISAFENLPVDSIQYENLHSNLNQIVKPGSFTIHNFIFEFKKKAFFFSPLLLFLANNSDYSNRFLNDLVSPDSILSDKGFIFLSFSSKLDSSVEYTEESQQNESNVFSYCILLIKDVALISDYSITAPMSFLNKRSSYVFHHLIKCGGNSTIKALQNWFLMEYDYLRKENLQTDEAALNNFLKFKFNILQLSSDYCLTGHFNYPGAYLYQRYPELLNNSDDYKIFTFVRDPLQFRISFYYYSRINDPIYYTLPLETYLKFSVHNYLSTLFPCNESNWKSVMDRYFFIGIVERMQESFDKLSSILGMRKVHVPVVNKSEKDSQITNLSPEFIEEFKKNNNLDYKIYNYCVEKFDKIF